MSIDTRLKNEQDVPMFEYNSVVQELTKIAKVKKEELDHQILLAKNNLKLLQEDHIRRQGEFNQWKMGEEQKFRNEMSKKHNQLIDQENKMNILHKDLEQRGADLLVKGERYMKVEEDKKTIGNARVEIEKIRVNAHNLMADADRKISEANSLMSQANTRIQKSIDLDNKNVIRNQELVIREDKYKFDLKNLEMERNHLSELKEFVEPKIIEIKQLEESIARDKKETEEKHQETINKMEEIKVALRALEDRNKQSDSKERELNSREDELKRKILIVNKK